jgi:hypothetical protein
MGTNMETVTLFDNDDPKLIAAELNYRYNLDEEFEEILCLHIENCINEHKRN